MTIEVICQLFTNCLTPHLSSLRVIFRWWHISCWKAKDIVWRGLLCKHARLILRRTWSLSLCFCLWSRVHTNIAGVHHRFVFLHHCFDWKVCDCWGLVCCWCLAVTQEEKGFALKLLCNTFADDLNFWIYAEVYNQKVHTNEMLTTHHAITLAWPLIVI